MRGAIAKVSEYYSRIDRGDLAWVVDLFAPHSTYNRAGVVYSNAEEIARFFRENRKIAGVHLINRLITDGEQTTVVAEGRFDGVGEAGDPRGVNFTDVWDFNDDGRVTARATYLSVGHAYVER